MGTFTKFRRPVQVDDPWATRWCDVLPMLVDSASKLEPLRRSFTWELSSSSVEFEEIRRNASATSSDTHEDMIADGSGISVAEACGLLPPAGGEVVTVTAVRENPLYAKLWLHTMAGDE